MFAYLQIVQQDDEPTAQYLIRAKDMLEHIHCTSKLSDISGTGLDNLPSSEVSGTITLEEEW